MIYANQTATAGAGMTFVKDKALVGLGLMYHPSLFPHPDGRVDVRKEADGGFKVVLPETELSFQGTTCNLMSPGLDIYGHWLVDCLPRLALALSSDARIDRYLLPEPRLPWKDALLALFSVPREKIVFINSTTTTAKCERMLLPTFARFNSEVGPALVGAYQRFTPSVRSPVAEDRLFVSRSQWNGSRPLLNRREIEAVFGENGFRIIRPETMTIGEVIATFAAARIVVGECGSGMHNTLFCPPHTRLGLIQSSFNTNYLPAQIAMWQDQEVWYLIGSEVDASSEGGDYEVDPSETHRFVHGILS
jgi:capsular polysaccharide biosynthesis protein